MNQPQPYPKRPVTRVPLTSGQHILHLILTLFTFGLWGIVWLIRGLQGNKIWADVPNPRFGYYPPQPYGPMPVQKDPVRYRVDDLPDNDPFAPQPQPPQQEGPR